ncbi:50S ribosomal protein L7/L12 [Candidatus Annandia adelgestsuga]|uniref:Large ribosomal subunit protein bL12 n=1 Tax=Candidatus Annandia adelgestsuga TaxID=1302411 RepID=A0A3S9J7P6_9ENTR|nr:50S ribosomal protein L7/L12 [Candidatus Annandia adelgestsuga]AZP36294.1 50S ribosomal protein L7/L12 [Candidatus Annandia adelgestsuga]
MSFNKEKIIETISNMSVKDILDLIKKIEKKFNISPSEYANNKTNNIETKVIKKKTEFKIILKSIGKNRISVIKAIRSITSLGLKESKNLVESAPVLVKENINEKECQKIKKILEEVGAEIEIK